VFHDLVRGDIQQSDANPPVLGEAQQRAIAQLINAGFDALQKDNSGQTPIDLANGQVPSLGW
jgi:hypothetical protein